MHSLSEGIYAKIDRAREQLDGLNTTLESFYNRKPYEIRHESDTEVGEKLVVFYSTEPLPVSWSVILGEIIHDLRSCLDHAVHELTIRECGQPLHGSAFPIFQDETMFFETTGRNQPTRRSGLYQIRGVSDKTRKVIEDLQPFRIQKEGQEIVTSLLHELSNIDKHRTLHLCRRLQNFVELRVVRDIQLLRLEFTRPGVLENRTILARWKSSTGLGDEVYLDAKVAFYIAFDERTVPSLEGQPVIKVCASLVEGVVRILDHLESSIS